MPQSGNGDYRGAVRSSGSGTRQSSRLKQDSQEFWRIPLLTRFPGWDS